MDHAVEERETGKHFGTRVMYQILTSRWDALGNWSRPRGCISRLPLQTLSAFECGMAAYFDG